MKLILKNIGLLKSAEVTIHPLCIIAGENDNGKSTVGKIIFCIIKAMNRYEEIRTETKDLQLADKTSEIFFLLRRSVRHQEQDSDPDTVAWDLMRSLRNGSPEQNIEAARKIEKWLQQPPEGVSLAKEMVAELQKLLHEFCELLERPDNQTSDVENAFQKIFAAEFDSSVLLEGATEGSIELVENNLSLLHLKIEKNNQVHLYHNIQPIELTDATFIESPLVINHYDALARTRTMWDVVAAKDRRVGVPHSTLHTKDLLDKLREPPLPQRSAFGIDYKLVEDMDALIDGKVGYSKEASNFVFKRDDQEISIKNTASGIKVFGLLQILVENDILTRNTMLIFDEPENHLHPKWQLKLAEILVKLAQQDVFVVVSSHSPYMIEALERYAKKTIPTAEAKFYLAKDRIIEDEDNLPEIFEVLAEPFEIFRQMDREVLKDG